MTRNMMRVRIRIRKNKEDKDKDQKVDGFDEPNEDEYSDSVQGVNDKSNQCETVIDRNNDVQVLWTVTVIMQHCSSCVKHKLKFYQVSVDKWFHYIVEPCLDTLFADILQLMACTLKGKHICKQQEVVIYHLHQQRLVEDCRFIGQVMSKPALHSEEGKDGVVVTPSLGPRNLLAASLLF
ncbi:hypothetical protein P692DRAFT_201809035 [Suillus brevipes Sb2]|nr:hypothetical protein P692DRAFT_201809035 [Suillus brevipes Sb2]